MYELREAFREAARREFAAVPAEAELDYVFSRRFERKMRRMIRAEAHGYWNLIDTAAKRVAIAAAILLMLLSTVMAIRPVRERVIRFFVEAYEEYFEIRFGEEEKDDLDPTPKPMVRYTLTELPAGYEEVRFEQLKHILWTHWKDPYGKHISLTQETGTNEITVNQTTDTLRIGTLRVDCYQYAEHTTYIWEQEGYVFYLSVYSGFPKEELEPMIESLKIYK